ncbi:nitrilase-related carbon-nitrogen hydrolase [Sulfobacillus harzensis]|uniref:Amidohydrolase family protein n=1 Tax=Sulfobacillus harzensis TaxID=2729629 RepID=A0A7Y0L0Z1_9FIRM|nr:amidohydrolase family protein [Sulfobacillus harzensis]
MSTPRIAVSQAPYIRDVDSALNRALDHMRHAASRGVDIVVFPEWFLGLNPVEVLPNRLTDRIGRLARELNVMVVTGSIRALEPESGKKQQRSLVIEPDGTLAGSHAKLLFQPTERPWFEPGPSVSAISTRWGRIVILPGLDAIDPDVWESTRELVPDLVVMAANPRTIADRNQIQEIAIQRSQDIHSMVVVAPLIGRFSGSAYVGGALIADHGRVLGMADEQETILIAGDPEAPLIQLGVTDISAYIPLARPLGGRPLDVKRAIGPEAERRVLVDWGLLASSEPARVAEELLAMARDNPRWIALAPARPGYAEDLKQLLAQGAGGAFIYPGMDRAFPWAESVRQLGRVLAEAHKPLLVHGGPGPAPLRFDSPALWDEFLMEFSTVPVIIHSMGQRSPYLEEALVLAERHPHVYLETSRAPISAIKEAIHTAGPDRVLFGSGGLAQDFHKEWEKVERLESEMSPQAFQKLVNLNARSLFFQPDGQERRGRDSIHPFRRPS